MSSVVSSISRYPLKSAAAHSLADAEIGPAGIPLDRAWMVSKIDPAGAEVLCTQRDAGKERLALVKVDLNHEAITLRAPDMEALTLLRSTIGEARRVLVHGKESRGFDMGQEAADWANAYLGDYQGRPLRLLSCDPNFERRPNQQFVSQVDALVAFADGYPVLITSDASLAELNRLLEERGGQQVLMSRFRPNIALAGLDEPFVEDRIKQLRVGSVVFEFVKPCSRCSVPAVNQETGQRDEDGKNLMRLLSQTRRGDKIIPFFPQLPETELNSTFFGQNAVVVHAGTGSIRVGDPVEILEYRK